MPKRRLADESDDLVLAQAPHDEAQAEAEVPPMVDSQVIVVTDDGSRDEGDDPATVIAGSSDGSTEKSVAAMLVWLVGATLTAGSAAFLAGGSDRGGSPPPRPDPLPEPRPEPLPRPKPEPKPEPVPDPKPEPEPVPDPKPEPVPEPKPEPMPEPKPEPMPEPKPEPMPEPKPEPMPEPKPEPMPEPKPEPVPEPKPEPVPEPEPEPKPEPIPDPKPEPVPEPKPEPVPDPKPDPEPARDDTPPASPGVHLLHDTGVPGDLITSDARVDISGLEVGATWKYSLDGVHWRQGAGTAIEASEFGGDGDKTVWVLQTDAAGNVSATSELKFTLDTSAAAPAVTVHSAARDNFPAKDATGADFYVSNRVNAHSWLQLELEAGATFTYSVDGSQDEQVGHGDRLDLDGLSEGRHEIRIRQVDVAGNVSEQRVLELAVENTSPVMTGQWTEREPRPTAWEIGWTMQADEDAQIVLVPVGTMNDGTPESYLENGRASKSVFVTGGKEEFNGLLAREGMYVVLAIDRAGNASFVSLRGSTTSDDLGVHAMEARRSGTAPDMTIASAAFDPQRRVWAVTAKTQETDHLFGSENPDHFVWGAISNSEFSYSQIDWIHGYNKQQGDVIDINDPAFQTLNTSVAADIARYFRKEILADGTISLWIDKDGLGQTYRTGDVATNFDQQILVTATHGADLTIHLANGGTVVL